MNRNLSNAFVPGENLTIDEQLKAFRGRCRFRQYMPKKPAKYGLKFFWITDSATSFPLKLKLYTGANEMPDERGLGFEVVDNLMAKYYQCGWNLTTDNFFTSVGLAKYLLTKGTTTIGTLKKNKPDIPKAFVVKEVLDDKGEVVRNNKRKVYRPAQSSLLFVCAKTK